jgi:hypothetical protein
MAPALTTLALFSSHSLNHQDMFMNLSNSMECCHSAPGGSALPRWVGGLFLPLVVLAAGCGGGADATKGTVSGKLTVNGKAPVPGCSVTYTGADNKEVSASVANDGSYTVSDVGVGDAKIVVKGSTTAVAPPSNPMPGAPPVGTEPIPAKYQQAGNGLTYTVKSGRQTHDIDLTP